MDELVTQIETKRDAVKKYQRSAELSMNNRKKFLEQIVESNQALGRMIVAAKYLQENVIFL